MGIPLRAGRIFQSGDLRGSPAVIVSERLAMSIFGTTDVVGRSIVTPPARGGARQRRSESSAWSATSSGSGSRTATRRWRTFRCCAMATGSRRTALRCRTGRGRAVRDTWNSSCPRRSTIQRIVKELDRRVPAANIRTLGSLVDDATARVRLTMLLIAVAGVAALLLGVIGVYSVVSYAANGRAREFGIRLALGAAPTRVGGMVLGEGLRVVAIGTFAGFVAALSVTRFLLALLYEVASTSVAEFGGATVLLLAVTLVATLLPARRAARTQPAVVLRGE